MAPSGSKGKTTPAASASVAARNLFSDAVLPSLRLCKEGNGARFQLIHVSTSWAACYGAYRSARRLQQRWLREFCNVRIYSWSSIFDSASDKDREPDVA